ncbi:hypothetical protein BGZ81_004826, partial [Podila clonocystis]
MLARLQNLIRDKKAQKRDKRAQKTDNWAKNLIKDKRSQSLYETLGTTLTLDGRTIGYYEAQVLAERLKTNSTLVTLNLG